MCDPSLHFFMWWWPPHCYSVTLSLLLLWIVTSISDTQDVYQIFHPHRATTCRLRTTGLNAYRNTCGYLVSLLTLGSHTVKEITSDYLSYEDNYNTVQLLFRIQIINKGVKGLYEVRFNFSLHSRNPHDYWNCRKRNTVIMWGDLIIIRKDFITTIQTTL